MSKKREIFNVSLYVAFFFVLMLLTSTYFVIVLTNFDNSIAQKTKDYVVLDNQDISSYYTESELNHLDEVKDLFDNFVDVLKYLWLSFILIIYFLRTRFFHISKKIFNEAFKLTTVVIVIATLIKLTFFDNLFAFFHRLFFTTQWIFDSSSLLIQLFPLRFWMEKTFEVVVLSFVFYFVVLMLYRKRLK